MSTLSDKAGGPPVRLSDGYTLSEQWMAFDYLHSAHVLRCVDIREQNTNNSEQRKRCMLSHRRFFHIPFRVGGAGRDVPTRNS